MSDVTIVQADREAAADYLYGFGPASYANHIKETKRGYFDGTKCVQAFARHRQASTEDLQHRLGMIVSHATSGHTDGAGMSVNDICVEISRTRNHVYQAGKDVSAKATDDLVEALREKQIPRDVAEQVLSMGRAEWAATAELTEAGHLEHLAESLRLTREHFNFEDVPVRMHGLYLGGTETVLCHTGTSPNSGANAQALAGAWNWLHDQCTALNKAGAL